MEKEEILCENEFCIYQENGKCILDVIELDISGMCQSCIYINISQEELNKKKKKLREELED